MLYLINNDCALDACVGSDLLHRCFQTACNDLHTGLLIAGCLCSQSLNRCDSVYISYTAACYDAFLNSCAGCVQCILDAELLLLHLGLGCSANLDNCYAAGQLGQTLLQLLTVEVRGGALDCAADLSNAVCDSLLVACTVNDGGVLLGYLDLTGRTQHIHGSVLQLDTNLLRDYGTAGQDCDVAEHILAAIAKARSLNSYAGEGAAQTVYDQGRQSLALNVLSDEQQLLAGLNDLLEDRQQLLNVGQLLIGDQHQSVIQVCFHLLGVGAHIRGDITAVELHALNNLRVGLSGLGLLNGDYAVGGNLLHSLCDQGADLVGAGGDSAYTGDVVRAVNLLGVLSNRCNSSLDCLGDTAAHYHRVCTCCYVLQTLTNESLRQNGSGGGAVACDVVGLGGNFLNKLCAHVLESVVQLDLLSDGNTVVGDQRTAVLLIQYNVAALRTDGYLNGISELINTALQSLARVLAVNKLLSHDELPPENYSTIARMSL